jgi:hypothetical protein
MSSENSNRGLPPVVAPSGRFIAQLFLVPGLIVAGAVAVLLAFTWLAGSNRGPAAFLRDLQSANADIRWRTASDLAQVLTRDDRLAANADFGLKLAELLKQALLDLERFERNRAADESAEGMARQASEYLARRSYVQYLCASVGNLLTPAGAPVLAQLARQTPSREPRTDALLRRQAVWALATLGNRLSRFSELDPAVQKETIESLEEAARGSPGDTAEWARRSLAYFDKTGSAGVVDALIACASAEDPFLRKQTAHALTFWSGSDEENRRVEAALVKLAQDDGHGTSIRIDERD